MANANPYQARMAKKCTAVQKVGSMHELREAVWEAVVMARTLVSDTSMDPATRLKAAHAVNQLAVSGIRFIEACEFEARIRAIEDARTEEHEL